MPEIETEAHEDDRQKREDSMWMRCPPTENENEPACADELSSVSKASKQNPLIGASTVRDAS